MISTILLAGGSGSRMKSETPKQFLSLKGKTLAFYSLEVFLKILLIDEIIIVCAPEEQHRFASYITPSTSIKFAAPGHRRQDSVFNGLQLISSNSQYVCIHDAARPCINATIFQDTFEAAQKYGAAVTGTPIKSTIKVTDGNGTILHTPDRQTLWEVQTPQIMRTDLLREGFQVANAQNLTVTDDVSLVELLSQPVKIVMGSHKNLKVTTSEDMDIAQKYV